MAKKSEVTAVVSALKSKNPQIANRVASAFGLKTADLSSDLSALVAHVITEAVEHYMEHEEDMFDQAVMEATNGEDIQKAAVNSKTVRQSMAVQNAVAKAVSKILSMV